MTLLTFTSLLLAAIVTPALHSEDVIRLRGSDTLGAKLVPQWAEAFKKSNPAVSFDIAAEGSSTAFTNLASGTAEIGMSSRKAKDEELTQCKTKGVTLKETNVAWDMIAMRPGSAIPCAIAQRAPPWRSSLLARSSLSRRGFRRCPMPPRWSYPHHRKASRGRTGSVGTPRRGR